MITMFRRLLIQIGKILPFVICAIVMFAYIESVISLLCCDYIKYGDCILLNTRISFAINEFIEYDWQMLAVLVITSFAVETCAWNKLACLYLLVNLVEKSYFDFELEPTYIYVICLANIVVAGYLTYKGLNILFTKQ